MGILNKRLAIGTDLGYSVLSAAIDDSQTSITVTSGTPFPELSSSVNRRRFIPALICGAAGPESLTFGDIQSGEHIVITDHAADSTTLTVIRGDNPISHDSGALIMILPTAQVWDSLFDKMAVNEAALAALIGAGPGSDAALLDYGATEGACFLATETDPPSMSLDIAAGIGAYGDQVFQGAATNKAFTAPTGSTRVDIIAWDVVNDEIAIVAGTEGAGAPSLPTNHAGLWEVEIEVGQTTLLNADRTDIRDFG